MRTVLDDQWNILSNSIHLIASACYPFPVVLDALAEPVAILPVEGLPRARYLPGAQAMDEIEEIGEELSINLLRCIDGYKSTMQPHSCTQANQMVFNAVLESGDKAISLSTKDGGHISHKVLVGRRNEVIQFSVKPDGHLDYNQLEHLVKKNKPKLVIVGGSSLSRTIDFEKCADISHSNGALLHADISHTATFVASGHHPSIAGYADFITFSTSKNLRGPNAGVLIYKSEFEPQVATSIFPNTQGGANESGLLAKVVMFDEWTRHDIVGYADQIIWSAKVLAARLMSRGIPVVTNGTDCHIILLDLCQHKQSGADLEQRLESAGILANRNLVPGDKTQPWVTSGLRIGSTNLAILGYVKEDLILLADAIAEAIITGEKPDQSTVSYLVQKYPVSREIAQW